MSLCWLVRERWLEKQGADFNVTYLKETSVAVGVVVDGAAAVVLVVAHNRDRLLMQPRSCSETPSLGRFHHSS